MDYITWLPDGWDRWQIDGRCTEIVGVEMNIENAVKIKFPPNEIPEQVMRDLNMVTQTFQLAEDRLDAFLKSVQKHFDEG